MRGKPLLALVAVLAVACGGPDPARYVAILDELAVPGTWELVRTEVVTPETENGCSTLMGSCPRVARYYLVDADASDAYAEAKQAVTAAGLEIDQEVSPLCNDSPPRSPACSLVAIRVSDLVQVSLWDQGEDPANLGVAEEGRTLIRVMAQPK